MNFALALPATRPPTAEATHIGTIAHRKLVDAAQQFEGMLLQELLKPMKEHGFCQQEGEDGGDGKDSGSNFGDTLNSFGAETMATAIAKGGGLGIAKRVVAQVEGEKILHDQGNQRPKFGGNSKNTVTILKFARIAPIT